jgi:hypothetical protein
MVGKRLTHRPAGRFHLVCCLKSCPCNSRTPFAGHSTSSWVPDSGSEGGISFNFARRKASPPIGGFSWHDNNQTLLAEDGGEELDIDALLAAAAHRKRRSHNRHKLRRLGRDRKVGRDELRPGKAQELDDVGDEMAPSCQTHGRDLGDNDGEQQRRAEQKKRRHHKKRCHDRQLDGAHLPLSRRRSDRDSRGQHSEDDHRQEGTASQNVKCDHWHERHDRDQDRDPVHDNCKVTDGDGFRFFTREEPAMDASVRLWRRDMSSNKRERWQEGDGSPTRARTRCGHWRQHERPHAEDGGALDVGGEGRGKKGRLTGRVCDGRHQRLEKAIGLLVDQGYDVEDVLAGGAGARAKG